MADETDDQNHAQTSEPSLADRVAALERALASLGDVVSPGHRAALKTYNEWRKSVD